jgi:hypothetical protein
MKDLDHFLCFPVVPNLLRNDETIISSISVTDIFFDVYLGKWNYRAIPKVKTWSYFLTIPWFRNQFFTNEGIIKKAIEDYGVA